MAFRLHGINLVQNGIWGHKWEPRHTLVNTPYNKTKTLLLLAVICNGLTHFTPVVTVVIIFATLTDAFYVIG